MAETVERLGESNRIGKLVVVSLLTLVLWVSFLDFPRFVAGAALDDSWQQALGYFFKHRMQAGVDYIFTYGPLGTFYTHAYDSDLFWAKYAWELAVKLLMALTVVLAAAQIRCWAVRAVFLGAVLLLPNHPDALYPLFIALLGLLALRADCSRAFLVFSAGLLAVLALVKFNLFVFAVATLLMECLWLLLAWRWRAALLVGVSFLACLLTVWCLTGQSLMHLPRYLEGSVQIAHGYVEAMAAEGREGEMFFALGVGLLCLASVAVLGVRAVGLHRSLVVLGFAAVIFFLQWKHCFLRPDDRTLNFFTFAALTTLACLTLFRTERLSPIGMVLACCAVALMLAGRFAFDPGILGPHTFIEQRFGRLRDNARIVLFPARLQETMEAQKRELQEQWSLPLVRAEVKDAPIDVISHQQGVLLLNELNYRPRPVFQSYSAYTPYLLAANARFFRSERAPEYLLVKLDPLDQRLPTSEDNLLDILRYYHPVLMEKSFLLLRQETLVPTSRIWFVRLGHHEQTIRFGEEVRLDVDAFSGGRREHVSLQVRPSSWGMVRKLLYKPAPVFLRVRLHDGRTLTYRLVPVLAEHGFHLNPFIEDTDDLESVLSENQSRGPPRLKHAVSFWLTSSMNELPAGQGEVAPAGYKDEVRVVIRGW